jgi:hypothetical protein
MSGEPGPVPLSAVIRERAVIFSRQSEALRAELERLGMAVRDAG